MSKKLLQKDKTRFTMWVNAEMLDEIEQLRVLTGKGSVADVIRDAVAVYNSLFAANKRGVRLLYENRKTGEKGNIWLLPGPPPFDEP